ETPTFTDCNLGDFAPLTTDRNVRAEHEQLRAVSDTLAVDEDFMSYRGDLRIQHSPFRWEKLFQKTLSSILVRKRRVPQGVELSDDIRPNFLFNRGHPGRGISLFQRWPRRSIGLYRSDVAVRACARGDKTDGARPQHSGGVHRRVAVLARET